ncbi:hypothetical protein RIF29_24561 [Crotalaria pallida]|uniref:Uncharacterized protein n=1 Tax=Crotalaria pallida TaxID=3830 RepID=A0AAN9HWQ8_CROPI
MEEMVRRGKVSGRRNFRRRFRSKRGRGSDDSDEDYVVSDVGGDVSDYGLDECASEESFDGFIEEEDEEGVRGVRKFNRSEAKNSIHGPRGKASKTSRKRGRIIYEQLEEEQEGDGDEDEDFNYDDDDDEEFTPEEEYCSDVEEETRGRKKKNNSSVKRGKKVSRRRVSVTSTRGRKRKRSRVSKKPSRKKRRKNGGLRRKVRSHEVDGFIDNGPTIRRKRRKLPGWVTRTLLLEGSNSDSDHVSGSPDYKYTVSEEEREQVREAKELGGSLRRNMRSSSLHLKNDEVGALEDLQQQQRPPGRKGKEKIEEPQGRKGKEKVEDSKSEVGKQVCGICLTEENKRKVRGVLNCCTHYFCFTCIMEWAKVESRCPLCKQRFKTICKPARSTASTNLREAVIQVPKRDQVYQPSEEEIRSFIDPYESVICSECHQGGDDGLMLLCDICDSPAHTYCVGLGREVPEGNWYCDGCKPVALGSSSSQVLEPVAPMVTTTQSPPVRPSPVHVPESIDLNLVSSPQTYFSQGFGHLSSSRFSGRNAEGASPVSGGGTLSERRRIHRHIQQLRSAINLCCYQSRERSIQFTSTQDVGTSYQTFFEDRLSNNVSPLMQNGDPLSTVQDSTVMFAERSVNGVLSPAHVAMPTISECEPVHQLRNRSNPVIGDNLSLAIKEESNFPVVKEQLQSMVKSHLKRFARDIHLGYSTFKDIARSSTHTILAACGLEHKKSVVCTVPPPPCVCPHIEIMAGGETSLIKGCCSSCFDAFVGDVVKRILDSKMSQSSQ